MSTPKPSLVKWVLHTNLTGHELQYANGSPMGKQIPVIPLSDLADVVEGLDAWTYANMSDDFQAGQHNAFMRLLDKLEAHRKDG